MAEPSFRFACAPSAVRGEPAAWAREMLGDGEIALLGAEGLDAINAVAHDLGLASVTVLRSEAAPELQDETVMAYADALPLIWVSPSFSDVAQEWARTRGPMTLQVQATGALPEDERRRIDRFVAILDRQAE
jgi:hypothetical protein